MNTLWIVLIIFFGSAFIIASMCILYLRFCIRSSDDNYYSDDESINKYVEVIKSNSVEYSSSSSDDDYDKRNSIEI